MSEERRFRIYRSNKLENFLTDVCLIIERLAKGAPLQKKSIVIQSNGMARWLTLKAASIHGAFANFDFVEPDTFLRTFAVEHLGIEPDSFYNKKKAEWALYSLLRSEKNSPAASYIGNNDSRAFRFSMILADLFEQYFVYRPKMMECWQAGRTMTDDPNESWQFEIFRRLAEKMAVRGFAQLFNEKCKSAPPDSSYPKELILFGISIMNRYQLNMFLNLSRLFPIHLFAVTPSREFLDSASKKKGDFEDAPEESGFSAGNAPDTFFRRFCAAGLDFADFTAENISDETDLFEQPAAGSLLSSIQLDILNDAETPEKTDADSSVKIISCRDKMREIEVLKDILLELFRDKELKPGDIAVMAPKINDYAPYISAVFGSTDPQDKDKIFIPYEISDRGFSSESGIASAFLELLKLTRSDFEKSKVLSLFNAQPVRTRFGTDMKSIGRIAELVEKSGIRWGLDADSRDGKNGQNTWDSGLSRIMMTLFMPFSEKGECFENILPMENISTDDFENISGFLTFAAKLFRCSKELSATERSPEKFKEMLKEILDTFFAFESSDKNSQKEAGCIRNMIDDFAETAGVAGKISFDALLQYFDNELGYERSGKEFLSAKVNFCSLKPLRALPFKVICLIGMGDGEFPRSENRYAFDLTQKRPAEENDAPRPRSVRDNDKYLFAEAVISAREKLFISYEAKDLSDDSKKRRLPAMPVRILEKYIEKKTGVDTEELETKYPAQPYSQEYFEKESGFRTFSRKDHDIAEAVFHVEQNPRSPLPNDISEEKSDSCGDTGTEVVELEKLISFLKDPAKYYLTKNLHLEFPDNQEDNGDEELFDYSKDYLLAYNIRSTYIKMAKNMPETFLTEHDRFEEAFINRIKCEGNIPFGSFGKALLKTLINDGTSQNLDALAKNAVVKDLESEHVSIELRLSSTKLEGMIKNISRADRRMIIVSPAKSKAKYQIEALIRHLAANAGGIEVDTDTMYLDKKYRLKHVSAETAKMHLHSFIELWKFAGHKMPIYDPDLIEAFKAPVKAAGTGNMSSEAVRDTVIEFFKKKQNDKKGGFGSLSQGFLLLMEQFSDPERQERFLESFPASEVQEAASLLDEFYSTTTNRSSKK